MLMECGKLFSFFFKKVLVYLVYPDYLCIGNNNVNKILLKIVIFVFLTLILSSCDIAMILSIRFNFDIKQSEIIEFSEINNIGYKDIYLLELSYFNSYIKNLDTLLYSKHIKNLLKQPIQVMYFNKKDSLIAFTANCLAPGVPFTSKLKWNNDGFFSTFPPKQNNLILSEEYNIQKIDISLDSIKKHITPIMYNCEVDTLKYDYTIVIFCGLMLKNQSKELIKIIENNIKLTSDTTNIKMFVVITDESYEYRLQR